MLIRSKFHDLYLEYAWKRWDDETPRNETPSLIHSWVGFSALAGACEKRVWIDMGFFKLWLNLYIVLVAPAGVCAKSTSIALGEKLLKAAGYEVLEGATTKERIIVEMAERTKIFSTASKKMMPHASVTYSSNELNLLLSTGVETIKFLVDIWDRDDLFCYKTKGSGTYEIENPFFNLIGAATPEWFGGALVSDMTNTGFLARCIVVYESHKGCKVPIPPAEDEKQKKMKDKLIKFLLRMGDLYGAIEIGESGRKEFVDWYMAFEINPMEDPRLIGYLERKAKILVLKIAALITIGDGRTKIEKNDIKQAVDFLEYTERKIRFVYNSLGTNKLAKPATRILSILSSSNGRVKLKDLTRMMFSEITLDELRAIIESLRAMGTVTVESIDGEKFIVAANK